jgi:hypothetical protein
VIYKIAYSRVIGGHPESTVVAYGGMTDKK